jgi:hypothetical protein
MSALVNPLRDAGPCRPLAAAAIVLETALRGAQADFDAARTGASFAEASALNLRFTAAMSLYKGGDWARAFAGLAALADLGHVPAARLALLMLRYGTGWFRTPFSATPKQVARWARQVLRAPPCVSRARAPQANAAASAVNTRRAPPLPWDRTQERHRTDAACHRAGSELDILWAQPAARQAVCD